jgi:hypothetical protein
MAMQPSKHGPSCACLLACLLAGPAHPPPIGPFRGAIVPHLFISFCGAAAGRRRACPCREEAQKGGGSPTSPEMTRAISGR